MEQLPQHSCDAPLKGQALVAFAKEHCPRYGESKVAIAAGYYKMATNKEGEEYQSVRAKDFLRALTSAEIVDLGSGDSPVGRQVSPTIHVFNDGKLLLSKTRTLAAGFPRGAEIDVAISDGQIVLTLANAELEDSEGADGSASKFPFPVQQTAPAPGLVTV
jgi:hypothetical protein